MGGYPPTGEDLFAFSRLSSESLSEKHWLMLVVCLDVVRQQFKQLALLRLCTVLYE